MPHHRRKNATPVIGMGEPTSIMLTQVASSRHTPYAVTVVQIWKLGLQAN